MTKSQLQKYLILSFGLVFFITGMAKVLSAFGKARVLEEYDPILGLSFAHLMLVAGILELGLAGLCWRLGRAMNPPATRRATIAVVWFSTLLVGYRFGLHFVDWHHPCRCLGDYTQALHLSEETADAVMMVILSYLFFGSYGLLIWQWKSGAPEGKLAGKP